MKKRILVLNGPNINLTGQRETGVYGRETLASINHEINKTAQNMGLECSFFQSNSEGEIIDQLHQIPRDFEGCILNAGAYTHYSYAIRDAITAIHMPVIEVHMSNIQAREPFRSQSVIAAACAGQIAGFGKHSYILALYAIKELL